MPFIPHTESEIKQMLDTIGVSDIDQLFDEIPADLRCSELALPDGLSEMEVADLMTARAERDRGYVSFLGGGVYEHHIPAAVWELTTRGEFYTAYTPYQAEASQGTLQLLYEFQTMVASLTGMDVSNASMYEGASALAEAVLAAVRVQRKARLVLMPKTVHPIYRKVVDAIVRYQEIEIVELDFGADGAVDPAALDEYQGQTVAAVVVPQPNYFGVFEDVDELTRRAHGLGALVIGLVNPTSLVLLRPPGDWGEQGADFAVGEGQPLGVPLSSGGPYFGFMCCNSKHVRQLPGRIVGRTVDTQGRQGFTLTLQAREQHIRRSKATSNICTNQGLMVTAATLYMSLLGADGLRRVAAACHDNTRTLVAKLTAIDGVERVFDRPFFHEAVIRLNQPVDDVLRALQAQGILGGLDLGDDYPQLGNVMLVCATEKRSPKQLDDYATHLERIISRRRLDPPCAQKV